MKKLLLFVAAITILVLSSAQSVLAKCETIVNVPSSVCVGTKVSLSISDKPCDCIKYETEVEWIVTDPSGSTIVTIGSPYSYVFSMVGTYTVCVKWYVENI